MASRWDVGLVLRVEGGGNGGGGWWSLDEKIKFDLMRMGPRALIKLDCGYVGTDNHLFRWDEK